MQIIESEAALRRALRHFMNPWLKGLLATRRDQLREADVAVGDLGPFIVVGTGDALAEIEAAAGFPIATNLVDGETFPSPDFVPSWEWCRSAQGWHEIVYVLSDDGSGAVLFVPDRDGIDPTLLAIIRAFGADGAPAGHEGRAPEEKGGRSA